MENSTIGNLVPRVFPLIIPHLHLAVLEHLEHHTLVIRIINYKAYNDLLLFVYLSMLLQRFYHRNNRLVFLWFLLVDFAQPWRSNSI
jgi:hypothetical protein